MVSKTNSRAASWWQKRERAGRDALGCAERPACFDRDEHSTVSCLPCRSGWASEAQCARAQSISTVCGGVTLFSPWHHHLCWPLASHPPWIQLLLSQPLCRLETFRTSLLSTIWEWVCAKFSGCETHWDHYPALLWEADGLHWVWLVGCCSHPFLAHTRWGAWGGTALKARLLRHCSPVGHRHTSEVRGQMTLCKGTVIALCPRTSELQKGKNFYFYLDFEVSLYKQKKELC